jgi:hypothetical protein
MDDEKEETQMSRSSGSRTGAAQRFLGVSVVVLAITALVVTSLPASAQKPMRLAFDRHRVGIQIGGGYASIKTDEDSDVFSDQRTTPDDFTPGMSLGLDYGYRLDEKLSLEAFVSTWNGTVNGDLGHEAWSVNLLGGAVRWRPTGQGLYFRGGFGAGMITGSLSGDRHHEDVFDDEYNEYGIGIEAAAGYDFFLTPNDFASGPRLEVIAIDVGEGVTATATNLLFCFTW